MSGVKWPWVLAGLLGVGAIGMAIVSRLPIESARVSATAPSSSSRPATSARIVVAAGLVEPAGEEFKIGADLDGRLARVFVEEGAPVKAGQVVAQLVNQDFRARVELARADVQEKQAQLERLRNGSRQEARRQAEAQLREAQVHLDSASTEVKRRQPLLQSGAISRAEYDLAARDEAAAKARVDAAQDQLNLVREETRAEDLRKAEAELASAEARLHEAEAMLEKTLIRSPISGRVLHRWKKTGEAVSIFSDTPILSVGNINRLRVRVDVDESDVSRIHVGQLAYVKADAYGDRRFTGHVVQIGQALGRKNVHTDEPTEKVDKKILETLVELDPGQQLPVGLRVDTFIE